MEDRLKSLETEVAYLRKEISQLIDIFSNAEIDNHIYYTNVYYSKDYLDTLTEDYNEE